jgi:hypothetical protein
MRRAISLIVCLCLTIAGALGGLYLLFFAQGWNVWLLISAGFALTVGAMWLYADLTERKESRG